VSHAHSCADPAIWSTLPGIFGGAPVGVPLASSANLLSATVNCETPQPKHTRTFGNIRTAGLLIFLRPRKWMFISAVNSCSLPDPHIRQLTTPPKRMIYLK
jgi:hypothetical protein